MVDPIFWLGLSLLMVAMSLITVVLVAIPTLRAVIRVCRSAEKLMETLNREVPPTLKALQITGLEIAELTEEVGEGAHHANRVVQQLDESISTARHQAHQAQITTRSLWAGVKAAWKTWQAPAKSSTRPSSKSKYPPPRSSQPRLSPPASAPTSRPPSTRVNQGESTPSTSLEKVLPASSLDQDTPQPPKPPAHPQ